MNEKKISVLHLGGRLFGGGAEKIFSITSNIFENTFIGGISEEKLDINFEDVGKKRGIKKIIDNIFSYSNYKKLDKFLSKNTVNIVHLHSFNGIISPSILAALIKHKNNIRIIQTLHDYNIICPNSSLFNYKKNNICELCIKKKMKYDIILKNCSGKKVQYDIGKFLAYVLYDKILKQKDNIDLFIVPSYFAKRKIVDAGIPENKIKVVTNPIESKFSTNKKQEKEDILVYFGRFSREKNIPILLEAFKEVLKKNKNLKLYLIGEGEEKKIYDYLIEKYLLNNQVIILPFMDSLELKNILKKAKISILPSKCYETFGLVIVESIYAKVFPIVNKIGALEENISSNLGETFSTKKELEEKIIKVLNNYDFYTEIINKKLENIKERHSLEKYKKEIYKVYLNVYKEFDK